jgi:hypothetical protein
MALGSGKVRESLNKGYLQKPGLPAQLISTEVKQGVVELSFVGLLTMDDLKLNCRPVSAQNWH